MVRVQGFALESKLSLESRSATYRCVFQGSSSTVKWVHSHCPRGVLLGLSEPVCLY